MVDEPPLVVLSARIGPLTAWETGIADRVPCRVEMRPLGTREEIASNGPGAHVVILGAVEPFDSDEFPGCGFLGVFSHQLARSSTTTAASNTLSNMSRLFRSAHFSSNMSPLPLSRNMNRGRL